MLWKNIKDVSLVGGKRIRPFLTAVGYGRLDEKILPIAVAQELIHIAMLIHDDIIDLDDFRHGTKNIEGTYKDYYKKYLNNESAAHYASSAALLAGDLLIAEAYQLIAGSDLEQAIKLKISQQLSSSIFEVVGGELIDIEAAFVSDKDFDPITIYRYKTASYSFIGPLLSGAYAAELSADDVARLKRFAEHAGIAYQMQDDLLGIYGDSSKTGKSTTTDLEEAKCTYLVDCHKKLMIGNEGMERNFRLFGSTDAATEVLEKIAEDMKVSGAYEKVITEIESLFNKAQLELTQLSDATRRDQLLALLKKLSGRDG